MYFTKKEMVNFIFALFFKNRLCPHLIKKWIHQILGLNLIQKVNPRISLILFVNTNLNPPLIQFLDWAKLIFGWSFANPLCESDPCLYSDILLSFAVYFWWSVHIRDISNTLCFKLCKLMFRRLYKFLCNQLLR